MQHEIFNLVSEKPLEYDKHLTHAKFSKNTSSTLSGDEDVEIHENRPGPAFKFFVTCMEDCLILDGAIFHA